MKRPIWWLRERAEELTLFILDRIDPGLAERDGREKQRFPFGNG